MVTGHFLDAAALGQVLLLLEAEADPDEPDSDGQPPLHFACSSAPSAVPLLLAAGADPRASFREETAVEAARAAATRDSDGYAVEAYLSAAEALRLALVEM